MDTDLFEPFLIFSENMVGIDFVKMRSHSALLELVRLSEEFGLYNLELEPLSKSNKETLEWGFDDMQFRKGEW